VTPDGEADSAITMASNENFTLFKAALPSIVKPVKYGWRSATRRPTFNLVKVRRKPTIAEVEVTLNYPPYLARQPETMVQKDADLESRSIQWPS